MDAIKRFFKTTILGGVIVILPAAILVAVFAWIWGFVTGLIEPLTRQVVAVNENLEQVVAQLLVLGIILVVCFLVGLAVRTAIGHFVQTTLEERLLKRLPGYSLVKETVLAFLGSKKSPFSSVALCRIFANDTLVTAFITDEHADGSYTVFVPTGPNPTSGNIFHLEAQYVHVMDLPAEDVMRSIISCGAGSGRLIEQYRLKYGAVAVQESGERLQVPGAHDEPRQR